MATGARAQTTAALRVQLGDGVPCSASELSAALTVRLPAPQGDGELPPLQVQMAGADAVAIALAGKTRVVPVAGLAGVAAARRIALAVVDLARAEAQPPRAPPLPSRAPPRPRAQLVLLPTVGAGDGVASVWAAGALGGSVRLHDWLRATLDVGYGGGPNAVRDGLSVDLQYLPIHAGLSFAPRRLDVELRLSAVAEPYWVRGGPGAPLRASGAVAGVGAAALFLLPARRRVQALVGVGVDAFVNRAEFLVHGAPALATERVAFWAVAGAALTVAQ
jgi:hypothetical protein